MSDSVSSILLVKRLKKNKQKKPGEKKNHFNNQPKPV